MVKELSKLKDLNSFLYEKFVNLAKGDQTLDNLFLIVKEEGWRINPEAKTPWKDFPEISKEVENFIRKLPQNKYETKDLSARSLLIFYGNALQGLYIAIGRGIRKEFAETLVPEGGRSEVKKFVEKLVDQLLFEDIGGRELSPERAAEVLGSFRGEIHWRNHIELFERSLEKKPEDLKEWLRNQSETEGWSKREFDLFIRAADPKTRLLDQRLCCRTPGGCAVCPNNLSFQPKKDNEFKIPMD